MMNALYKKYLDLKTNLQNQEGQTMVEYVMLIVLVALAVFLIAPGISNAIRLVFSNTSSALAITK